MSPEQVELRATRETTATSLGGSDFALAGAHLVFVALLYHVTLQTRFWGDGAGLCDLFLLGGSYHNFLYLPLGRLLGLLIDFESPFGPLQYLSVWSAAVGAACTFLIGRQFGAGRFGATVGTLLLVFSPALWFFGTSVEIHALHFGVAALCGCVTLLLPWERPALSLAITALVFPCVYLAHQTAVLVGPGWVFLVQYARSRRAEPFRWRTLLLVVGPVLLAALLLTIWITGEVRATSGEPQTEPIFEQIIAFHEMPVDGRIWWREWMNPLRLVLLVALAGAVLHSPGRHGALALGSLLVVPFFFFLWWGVPERGGYFLGTDAFLAALAARAFAKLSPVTILVAAALLLGQAVPTRMQIAAYDRGFPLDERVERVRDVWRDGALYVQTADWVPSIRVWLPEVEQLELREELAHLYPRDTDAVVQILLAAFRRRVEKHGRVILDLGYRNETERPIDRLLLELMDRLLPPLRAEFEVEEVEHAWWGMLILEARG